MTTGEVEVVRLSRDEKPECSSVVDLKTGNKKYSMAKADLATKKRDTVMKKNEYASETALRTKFDTKVKTDVHFRLSLGTSFHTVSQENWDRIFGKKKEDSLTTLKKVS